MKHIHRLSLRAWLAGSLLAVFMMLPGSGAAQSSGPKIVKSYEIPGHATIEYSIPASWREEMRKTGNAVPPSLVFRPRKGRAFSVQMTLLWNDKEGSDFTKAANIKSFVHKSGTAFLPNAVETELTLNELSGVDGRGYYYTLTDKAPRPGEYRYMTHGGIGVGNILLVVTVLSSEKDSAAAGEALVLLRGAAQRED